MTEEQNASPGDTHEEQVIPDVPTAEGPEVSIAPSDPASVEHAIENATAEVGHANGEDDLSAGASAE